MCSRSMHLWHRTVLRNAPLTGDGSVTVTGLGFGGVRVHSDGGTRVCSMQHIVMDVGELCGVPGERVLWVCRVCGGDCGCTERHRSGGAHIRPWAGGGVLVRCGCGVGVMLNAPQRRWVSDCAGARLRQLHYTATAALGSAPCSTSSWSSGTSVVCQRAVMIGEAADCGDDSGGCGGDRVRSVLVRCTCGIVLWS